MKRNSILFAFICLCITVVNNSFHAQEWNNFEDRKKAMQNKLRDFADSNAYDPNAYGKIQSWDPSATNFKRFKNSPCFDELGFNPMGDLASLEQAYRECEKVKNSNRNLSVLYILAFVVLLSAIIFFSLPKEKRLAIIKKLK